MDIREFLDLNELEQLQLAWAKATGLASVFVDEEGNYITGDCNFTDFCGKYTRATKEGGKRCVDAEQNGLCKAGIEKGCYKCHAGLVEFAYPIRIAMTGDVVMTAIGGQVRSSAEEVDEGNVRKIAKEIGVDEERYVAAMHQVPVMTEAEIQAKADLLEIMVSTYVNQKFGEYLGNKRFEICSSNLVKINDVIDRINLNSKKLTKLASKEGILALNSAIEAARLGTAGASFSILAKQQSDLSKQSGEIYEEIGSDVTIISDAIEDMNRAGDVEKLIEKPVNIEEL